jgi:hypothetical protein
MTGKTTEISISTPAEALRSVYVENACEEISTRAIPRSTCRARQRVVPFDPRWCEDEGIFPSVIVVFRMRFSDRIRFPAD